MQVDTNWIASNFNRFNKEYFGGGLPLPKFSVSNARTRLGCMAFKYKMTSDVPVVGKWKREMYDFSIRISNYYDQTELQFQNVLLHEMIHYYIAVNQFTDDAVHGTLFRSIAQRLNKLGWHITVRSDTRQLKVAERNKNRLLHPRIVLAAITTDGKCFLSVIGRGSVRKVEYQITHTSQIKSHLWFVSVDAYFQNYPQSRSLRGRFVSQDVWKEIVDKHQATIVGRGR